MKYISILLIFSFVSCASYSEQVKQNETDLDRMEQIVFASNDIPKTDMEFIKNTLSKTKKLLDKGVDESVLADRWREWIFNKWLFVALFVLGIAGLIVLKFNSFSLASLVPDFLKFNLGGMGNA
ncbi:hypothetical protein [Leptospira alexanderi]|uniref:Lipoprotein n=2 Tax=Leptospira alexanderi TaxID=100053 RepID=V6HWL3_9LEPT|nr:hypothetical protein [Leptospira alexanderi]EQA61856.1 putative lipoprotein [Leptospira alexanderi serovar Manhao 3 str. L 60]